MIEGIQGTADHLELRKRESAVVVQKIEQGVDVQRESHSPRSLMGKALTYAHDQRERLQRFLEDPKLALDRSNPGHEQRGIRPFIAASDPTVNMDQQFPLLAVVPVTGTPRKGYFTLKWRPAGAD